MVTNLVVVRQQGIDLLHSLWLAALRLSLPLAAGEAKSVFPNLVVVRQQGIDLLHSLWLAALRLSLPLAAGALTSPALARSCCATTFLFYAFLRK